MIINKLKQKLSGQFIRNVGWLGGAELVNRIFRLATTVTFARLLSPYDYGLAAIVMTTLEFATVFTLTSGIGAKIIQAKDRDVESLCNTAYWLNWLLCISLFIIQCAAAFPIAWFYKANQVVLPLCVTALLYLMLPFFTIQSVLIQRENRLNITATCHALQAMLGNTFAICLAFLGMGVWAVVLPPILTTPVWIVINRRNHAWRPTSRFTLERWQEIVNFSKNILSVELLDKLRANLDYLLVGRFLGVDALGLYYFAFNAGLGISLNVMNALTLSLYPHLCEARENLQGMKERYFSSLKSIAVFVVPVVLLQSSLAPFYVPLIFGSKWVAAIPILVLICLSALPRPFANAASQLLRAVDKSHIDLYWNLIFTVIFSVALLIGMQGGIYWVAASVLISHVLAMPIFTVWASRYVFALKPTLPAVSEES